MAEIFGWQLTIQDYEHEEDEINPVTKYYIRRNNAINAGILLLTTILDNNGWDDESVQEAKEEYWKLMNNTTLNQNTKTGRRSYFDDNGINIELTLIPYEDELK